MYSGRYPKYKKNLANEFINLFKSDNGKNYIYVTPYGTLGEAHKNSFIEVVLLVRRLDDGRMDVIAKAEDLESIYFGKNGNKNRSEQDDEILSNHIFYGGKILTDLVKDNCLGNGENPSKAYITYRAGKVTFAKKESIVLDVKELSSKDFSRRPSVWYYSQNKSNERADYETLKKLINNPSNWITSKETEPVDFESDYMSFLKNRIIDAKFNHIMDILKQRIQESI